MALIQQQAAQAKFKIAPASERSDSQVREAKRAAKKAGDPWPPRSRRLRKLLKLH
jgi:hypothetical protein